MDRIRKTIGISLLLLLGSCRTTAPTVPRLDDIDPFRFAQPNPFALPEPQPFFNAPVFETPVNTDEIPAEPPETEVSDEILEEKILFEQETAPIITEAEQAELLAQNQWVQNVNLINTLDTGRKLSLNEAALEERQRREQFNLLSMSNQERAKRQNQQYDVIDGSVSDWRWMHRGVDRLYAVPPEQRESAEIFLRSRRYRDVKYNTLRANAAILLGRDGNPAVADFLLQLVQDNATPIPVRCAATEVLGHMPTVTADDLIPLLETVKERKNEDRQQQIIGITEIWSQLLIAIAEKIDPWEHACFIEPFYASSSGIRLETAKIWRRKSLQKRQTGELPEKFFEIAKRESNPLVRVEIIKTLGAWRVPDLFQFLEYDLNHRTADVRNAAMLALADARSQEAVPIVKDQLRDSNHTNRAAAVSALRKLGALDEVFKLVNDQHFLVRVEVAQAFAERCTAQTAAFAKSYLSDRHVQVQSATVEAVSSWSIEESGPLLLLAAKSMHTAVRRQAVEILAQRGVFHPGFDPEDQPKNQTAQYEELVHQFRETVGVDPHLDWGGKEHSAVNDPAASRTDSSIIRQVSAVVPEDPALTEIRRCLDEWQDRTLPSDQRYLIQRRLTAHSQRLMPLIDHLLTVEKRTIPESLDRVFAEVEPMFSEIEKVKSGNLATQQAGARELARWGAVNNPSKLAAKRIIDLAARQSDPAVLTSLVSALQNADPELTCQLARPLLQSESIAVRRVACDMLAQFGGIEDVPLLRETLRDPNRTVVRGALQAIDALLAEEETGDSSVFEALKAMLLQQGDPGLRTDAAATLHRLGRSEGTDELRRLMADNDVRNKSYAIRVISGLGDSVFVPWLLNCLDDNNNTIRSEALKGLPVLTGQDIGNTGSTQQQIDRWKAWAKER
jgi:HEAT repeat protein